MQAPCFQSAFIRGQWNFPDFFSGLLVAANPTTLLANF
jgi:hypothetical protein